jgi:hypothetical protein
MEANLSVLDSSSVTHQAPDTPLETGGSSVRVCTVCPVHNEKKLKKVKQAEAAKIDSAADEGTRNRRAPEPSNSSSSGTSDLGLHGKRVRQTEDSPLQISRPQKRPKTTKSFRDVVQDSLKVFIINVDVQSKSNDSSATAGTSL